MQFLKPLACAALALALTTTASAQKKVKARKASLKPLPAHLLSPLPAHLAALDTLRPVTAEEFSYALGVVQNDVQWQAFKQNTPTTTIPEAELRSRFAQGFITPYNTPDSADYYKAYNAGVTIAKMTDAMFINNKLYRLSLTSKDNFFDAQAAREGFLAAFMQQARYTLDSAKALTQAQSPYYEAIKVQNAAKMMADNLAAQPTLKTTPSGLQYRIITAGTGQRPTDSVQVKVNYEGRLFDGRIFDSSYERGTPATFGVTQVIKGWTEILQLMPVGSTWEVYIPQELAYGVRGTQDQYDRDTQQLIKEGIPAYAPLIFKIELLEIVK